MEDSREAVQYKLIEILSTYKQHIATNTQAIQVNITDNMKLLPILTLALLKHTSLRLSTTIPTDMRAFAMSMVYSLPVELLTTFLHPKFYALHLLDKYVFNYKYFF